jgi:hypothetical protein
MSLRSRLFRRDGNEPSANHLEETAFALWGGILDGVDIDLKSGTLVLRAHVESGGTSTATEIQCEGVTAVSFATDIPWPWNYAEITDVRAGVVERGVHLELTLWADPTALAVTASRITVGGQLLEAPFSAVGRELT